MDIALIPPISRLGATVNLRTQMVLPTLLKDDKYKAHMKYLREWDGAYVILDNGMFEEGRSRSVDSVLDLAQEYQVNEIVIPDKRGDRHESLVELLDFIESPSEITDKFNLMAVVQGKDYDDIALCLADYVSELQREIGQGRVVIGIPRRFGEDIEPRARIQVAQMIISDYPHLKIHLLGLNRNMPDDISIMTRFHRGSIRSVDTSAPFVYAYHGARMLSGMSYLEAPEGYFNLDKKEFDANLVNKNIDTLKVWANGGQ